ncbi:hypothetical protein SAMN05660420_03057 [Desulfuromusa kysingii]|uniref:Uncharacterized protein n=1 Tax=Desulfuromusa kysingii TaxID=37625 RepID=A0A1H4DQG4_9BACT|nr:hypothetical protein [Desulfuromusa kysingii]SEA74994.1 hypothetical protein SAMN05660420_03057 [Desulfuromusa kysingii]
MKRMRWCRVEITLVTIILIYCTLSGWAAEPAREIRLDSNSITGVVDKPLQILVEGVAEQLPSGHMYSVVADTLAYPGPTPPAILTGIPDTTIDCKDAGDYRIRIRVNVVNKSSCGGASVRTLLDQEVTLHVLQRTF